MDDIPPTTCFILSAHLLPAVLLCSLNDFSHAKSHRNGRKKQSAAAEKAGRQGVGDGIDCPPTSAISQGVLHGIAGALSETHLRSLLHSPKLSHATGVLAVPTKEEEEEGKGKKSPVVPITDLSLDGSAPVSRVDFSLCESSVRIAKGTLACCDTLVRVNLAGLSHIKEIGDMFLFRCTALEYLDCSPLVELESIGNNFLAGCTALKLIRFKKLHRLTNIGDNFMIRCASLPYVDLSDQRGLRSIGNAFLLGCKTIQQVVFSPTGALVRVGSGFMLGCEAITEFTFPIIDPSGKVHANQPTEDVPLLPQEEKGSLGGSMLRDCIRLKKIDTQNLIHLIETPPQFMCGAASLQEVDFSGLMNVQEIKTGFLSTGMSGPSFIYLKELSLTFPSCIKIHDDFLEGSLLESIQLSGLGNLVSIGDRFLARSHVIYLTFTGGSKATEKNTSKLLTVGNDFLRECKALKALHFNADTTPFTSVTDLGDHFMTNCRALEDLDASGLKSVQKIGEGFMEGCHNLSQLQYEGASEVLVTKIGLLSYELFVGE